MKLGAYINLKKRFNAVKGRMLCHGFENLGEVSRVEMAAHGQKCRELLAAIDTKRDAIEVLLNGQTVDGCIHALGFVQ